ncbi:hypothetical protein [Streptomyces griseosporeus]
MAPFRVLNGKSGIEYEVGLRQRLTGLQCGVDAHRERGEVLLVQAIGQTTRGALRIQSAPQQNQTVTGTHHQGGGERGKNGYRTG